jgi:hypothetical protein
MRRIMVTAAQLTCLLAILNLVFLACLVVGAAVPDRAIVDHLVSDVHHGRFPVASTPDGVGGTGTTYTDCVAIGTGLGKPEISAASRAIRMPRLASCTEQAPQLVALERGDEVASGPYFRYWAGYTVLTRPALALGGIDAVRMMAAGLFSVSLLVLVLVLARRAGNAYTVALLAPLLAASNIMTLPTTGLSQALSNAVGFLGTALVAWAATRSWQVLAAAAVVAGATYNFVDLLTTPAVTWALTAAAAAAVAHRTFGSRSATMRSVLITGGLWPLAFSLTWIARWLFAMPFVGARQVMDNVLAQATYRINGATTWGSKTPGAAIGVNVRRWIDDSPTALPTIVAGMLVIIAALMLIWRRHGRGGLVDAAILAAPSGAVLFWLTALNNHSQIHAHFVYRNIPAMLGVVTAACVLAASRARGDGTVEEV